MDSVTELEVVPLGGGQEVGRSCILIRFKGTTVMLDCGLAASLRGKESLPMLSELGVPGSRLESFRIEDVDALIISHFHVDHAAAVPYLTERIRGFRGRVFATDPTIAVLRLTLSDQARVSKAASGGISSRHSLGQAGGGASSSSVTGESSVLFSEDDVDRSVRRIQAVQFREKVEIASRTDRGARAGSGAASNVSPVSATFYHAGHVLGAAMVMLDFGSLRVLYTGDWTGAEDRHLMAADLPSGIGDKPPDVIIGESTTGIKVLESRQARERRFCQSVEAIVGRRGRCLLPASAVGRAQELLLILDELWSANPQLQAIPLLYCSRQSRNSLDIYGTYSAFMNSRIQAKTLSQNPWNLKYAQAVRSADDVLAMSRAGPCVAVVAPGFLHTGASRQLLEAWAGHRSNGVIITGFNPEGTMARELLGRPREIMPVRGGSAPIKLNCSVEEIAFMAHADLNENLGMIRAMGMPKTIILVHGELNEMNRLKNKLTEYYWKALEEQCKRQGKPKPQVAPFHIEGPGNLSIVHKKFREDRRVALRGMLADGAIAALAATRSRADAEDDGSSPKRRRVVGAAGLAIIAGIEGCIVSRTRGATSRQVYSSVQAGQQAALHQSRLWSRTVLPVRSNQHSIRSRLHQRFALCFDVWDEETRPPPRSSSSSASAAASPASSSASASSSAAVEHASSSPADAAASFAGIMHASRMQWIGAWVRCDPVLRDAGDVYPRRQASAPEWGVTDPQEFDEWNEPALASEPASTAGARASTARARAAAAAGSAAPQVFVRWSPMQEFRADGLRAVCEQGGSIIVEWEAGGVSDALAESLISMFSSEGRREKDVQASSEPAGAREQHRLVASPASGRSKPMHQGSLACCLPAGASLHVAEAARVASNVSAALMLRLGQSSVHPRRCTEGEVLLECELPGVPGTHSGVQADIAVRVVGRTGSLWVRGDGLEPCRVEAPVPAGPCDVSIHFRMESSKRSAPVWASSPGTIRALAERVCVWAKASLPSPASVQQPLVAAGIRLADSIPGPDESRSPSLQAEDALGAWKGHVGRSPTAEYQGRPAASVLLTSKASIAWPAAEPEDRLLTRALADLRLCLSGKSGEVAVPDDLISSVASVVEAAWRGMRMT